MVGAIEGDTTACHLVSIARTRLKASNEPITIVNVRSTTTFKGRVLQLWHISHAKAGAEPGAMDRSLANVKAIIENLPRSNP